MNIEKLRPLGHFDEKNRRQALFSMDYCPSSDKLVVAGLDSSLSFWSNVLLEPKKLATITRHDGAVLCVRWAPTAIFEKFQNLPILASGADDAVLLIWQQESSFSNYSGNLEGRENSENYRVIKRLSGFHSADITGIEWSRDGRYLASCSIDGTVCIYDVYNGFRLMSHLDDHRASVKGLSWSPVSNMLLSQGADKQTLLYKFCKGVWNLELNVEEPLSNSSYLDSLFARNSWSHDGKYFAVANASNGLIPAAVICETHEPTNQISLIGHLCSVEIVKFCPWPVEYSQENAYLLAVASQDGWISIWNSNFERPLAVVSELFDQGIMDLVWFHSKNKEFGILACSYDGYVSKFTLSPVIFGSVIENVHTYLKNESSEEFSQDKIMNVIFESRINKVEVDLGKKSDTVAGKKRIAPTLVTGGTSISSSAAPSVLTTIEIKISGCSNKRMFNEIPGGCFSESFELSGSKIFCELQNIREGQYLLSVMTDSKSKLWDEKIQSFIQPHRILIKEKYLFVLFEGGKVFTFSIHSGRRIFPIICLSSSIAGLCIAQKRIFIVDVCGNYCVWSTLNKALLFKGVFTEENNKGDVIDINFLSQSSVKIETRECDFIVNLNQDIQSANNRPENRLIVNKLEELKLLPNFTSLPDIENTLAFALSTRDQKLALITLQHYIQYLPATNSLLRLEELNDEINEKDEDMTACKSLIRQSLEAKSFFNHID